MTNNASAFPAPNYASKGLTKRELIAAMAMQGITAAHPGEVNFNAIATRAVKQADALLAELAKE